MINLVMKFIDTQKLFMAVKMYYNMFCVYNILDTYTLFKGILGRNEVFSYMTIF